MKRLSIALLISLFLVIVSGCQENNSPGANRRANLIGTEKLRTELKEKDARINELETKLNTCMKENERLKIQSAKSGAGFMEIFSATSQKVIELEKENKALKEKIKELEK